MNLLTLTANSYSRSTRYLKHGPTHFLMYVLGRFAVVRSIMVWTFSLRSPKSISAEGPAHTEKIDVEQAVRSLGRDGFVAGLRLRPEIVGQLQTFSSMATCFGDGNLDYPFLYADKDTAEQQAGRTFKLGRYNHALPASPALQALAVDPQLLAIARKYLTADPVLISVRMWWSFSCPADVSQQKEAGQGFHYDLDGYRGLAFFFYLTDVGPSNGPHVYVRRSHVKKSLRHLVSIYKGREDAEIDRVYGRENQIVCCGPTGSGFAEDLFGFHKGLHPQTGNRLVVQLRYGLRDYGTGHGD